MINLILKFTYPVVGGLFMFWVVSTYAKGDFGTTPEEVNVPRDVSKNPGAYKPRYRGGGGFFIFRGK